MAQFVNMRTVELTAGSAPNAPLGRACQGDHKANRLGAIVIENGQPVALSGNCAGTAILNDGSTVPLTGVISGNEAYVELDSACYQVEGPITVFVKWINGTLETTLISFFGTLEITETGAMIQPSTPIPDLAQLMAQIEAMQEATAAAIAVVKHSVRYDIGQILTDVDKARARANIGIAATINSMAVRYDRAMGLTDAQKLQARLNAAAAYISSLAIDFSPDQYYAAGSIVSHEGYIWYFTSNHAAGAWTGNDVDLVSVAYLLSRYWVRADAQQGLTVAEKVQARENIGAAQISPTDSGGSETGMLITY